MASDLSSSLGSLLLTYAGPEPDRVRTAIAALAKDDLEKVRYFLGCANTDYRDVLWWAQQDSDEAREKLQLSGMTVNERLSHLGLFPAWDAAVAARDVTAAKTMLQRCALSEADMDAVLNSSLGRA